MVKFNPNIPESESRLLSAPIRQNFNALNDRTDQLSISNTVPESTSIIIGKGDKVYFQNNKYTPFTGITLDLGDSSSGGAGVQPFSIANRYKKIVLFYKDDGTIDYTEGPEEETRDLSTTSVAALTSSLATTLEGKILLCCVLVTNNGTPGIKGAINPIFESDLLDIRPFLQRTTDTQLIDAHIAAATLAEAHPGATVSNILLEATTVGVTSVVSPTQFVLTSAAEFIPSAGNYPAIRFSSDATPTTSTKFQTAKVLSVVGNTVTVDRPVTSSPSFATKGKITLDRMNFDILEEFESSGLLERNLVDGYIKFKSTASISLSSVTATTFSGALSGNASTASTLQTARNINGVSFDGSSNILITPYTTADESTNATRYLAFMDSASDGYQTLKKDSGLSYNPSTNTLSTTTFSGSLSGNASTASTLQTARNINGVSFDGSNNVLIESYTTADESTNATRYLAFMDSASDGYQTLKKDSGLSYNPSTNTLSTTTFSGSLSGNATNVTGIIAIANGGTGQTSANAGLNALLPSQTSHANKLLVTDGSNTGWSQITDAYISSSAGIADTKLATISTAGKVSNSATSATTSSTASTIVLRDGYGNVAANKYTGGIVAGSGSLSAGSATVTLPSTATDWVVTVSYSDTSSTTTAIRVDSRSGNDVTIKGTGTLGFEYIAIKI